MPTRERISRDLRVLRLAVILIAVVFTALLAASLGWNVHRERNDAVGLAKREALATFSKDAAFRAWVTKHGGVYVPTTVETQPSPYLSHMPERDVVTPSGRRLTLMNPAMQEYQEMYGVKGRITSLKARKPENLPDTWEREALEAFASGATEAEEICEIDGRPVLRYMRPMMVREGCLKCHAFQGYKEGDVRGGVSVAVPLWPYLTVEKSALSRLGASYLLVWVFGMGGLGLGFSRLRAGIAERRKGEEILASQKQLLEAFFENTLSCNAILDRDFNFIRVNDAYARADGRRPEDFPGHNHFEFYPSEVRGAFDGVVATGTPYEAIARPFVYAGHPERGVTYWDWTLAPIVDAAGNVEILAMTLRNVTARVQAQENLTERATLAELAGETGRALTLPGDLRGVLQGCAAALVRHVGVAFARIWTFNADEEVLELQASAGMYTRIDGAHSRIPLGKLKIGMIARDRWPHLTNAVIGDPLVEDQAWARREGMVAFAGHPLLVGERLVGVMAMFSRKPLTEVAVKALEAVSDEIAIGIERKRTDLELMKLSTAIAQSSASVIITNTRGEIEFVNPGFTQVSGYSFAEAKGRNPRLIKSGRTPAEVYSELWGTICNGGTWRGELCNRKKNGGLFWEHATISPVMDEDGTITHYVAIKEDVTEKRKTEEELRHAQKMEAIGTFTGGIAHDFNNIITAIFGFGSILESELSEEDPLKPYVTQILAAAERAAGLTSSLLAFCRKKPQETKPLCLNAIVAGMERMLRRFIREDIDLRLNLAKGSPMVLADAGQIEQVLLNLAVNARDAMPAAGTVTITTAEVELSEAFRIAHGFGVPGRYALLGFNDTGEGMEETVRQRIFEPFFTTKEAGRGTGLGLSVVYGIVKQHNGYIDCHSEPGRGTMFSIYFPLIQASAVAREESAAGLAPRGTETILLAEDDATVCDLVAGLLTDHGYEVVVARDGDEAVARFRERGHEIKLCLFDLVMPTKGGREAYDEITRLCPGARVLFMSGYQAENLPPGGLVNAAAGFIGKPLMPRDLLRKVRAMLDT